ncbi:MAG: gliding motility lipoprotein GldD [Vicingaceae bacterium]
MRYLIIFFLAISLLSCDDNQIPRPTGYFRIDLPKKAYKKIDTLPFPFQFELPQYAYTNLERTKMDSNFLNIDFPRFGARIHMSYAPVGDQLPKLLEDSRALVYKHAVKAQDIAENQIVNPREEVYGMFYEIEGNAASGSQFYLTDSTDHFLRGALYFNVEPNYDSIAPVLTFVKQDIEHLIRTFNWKESERNL